MKKQTTLMTIAMVLCLFVSYSCNKSGPDDTPEIRNEMQVGDQNYELAGGLLIDWRESNNGAADYDLALYTEGITINEEGQPENEGSMIYFDLNSYASNLFEGGRFTFGTERGPGVITGASLVLDYNGDPNGIPMAANIVTGQIFIEKVDGNYEAHFDAATADGDFIQGRYVGPLLERTND